MANMSGQTKAKIQNLGYQVADMAVQFDMGTRASTIFAQQGSQILAVFGPMGAVLGAVAAVTLPLLGAAFASSAEDANLLEKAVKGVKDEMSDLKIEVEGGRLGLVSKNEIVVALQIESIVRRIAEVQQQIAAAEALGDARSAGRLQKMRDTLSALVSQKAEYDRLLAESKKIRIESENINKALEAGKSALEIMGTLAANFRDRLSEAAQKAREASGAMARFYSRYEKSSGRGGPPKDPAGQTFAEWSKNNPNKTGGSGGGSSGGGATTNPMIAELEAIRQSLLSQEQAQIESFARQQETLRAALEQKLLTQQEYAALMEAAQQQHAEQMSSIDVYRYGTGLAKANEFFGSMATAMQGGNQKMLKIAKAFGVAQALISTYTGAAEALKLPFPANLAAFAKVMATGMGAVSQIKGVSASGGGAVGGATTGGGDVQSPQMVRIQGLSRDQLYTGDMIKGLFDSLVNESKDRGVRFITT